MCITAPRYLATGNIYHSRAIQGRSQHHLSLVREVCDVLIEDYGDDVPTTEDGFRKLNETFWYQIELPSHHMCHRWEILILSAQRTREPCTTTTNDVSPSFS